MPAVTFSRFPSSLTIGDGVKVNGGRITVYGEGASVKIGNESVIGEGAYIECGKAATIAIGEHCLLFHHNVVSADEYVIIGSNSLLGEFSSVRDSDHEFARSDMPINRQGFRSEPVSIGDDVWIGRGVAVLKGATIGSHSVIGANSVVTGSIPDWSVAAGVPARVIKYREKPSSLNLNDAAKRPS